MSSSRKQFIDHYYDISFPMQKNKLVNKAAFAWNNSVRALMRKAYPGYCEKHPVRRGICEPRDSKNIIVSMTSFPKRMSTIEPAIQSILRQTMKPDRVIVWLAKDENPGLKIPAELEKFLDAGLEVRFSDENLKPHNKSFHTARLFPDSFIVTVDDDIIYAESLIERLYATYLQCEEKTVVCEMAHEITLGKDGKPNGYEHWNWESIGVQGPSDLLLAKGVGGVLYPPGFFAGEYFDIDAIRETCLMADDLWLKFIALVRGYKVKKTRAMAKNVYAVSEASQQISLKSTNNGENRNTVYLKKLCAHFNTIDWERLR